MAKNLLKSKNRKETGLFVLIPHCVLESKNFYRLSGNAVKLLVNLVHMYRGKNNGALSIAWSHMQHKGWRNYRTLRSAMDELIFYGFTLQTKQWSKRSAALFAISWKQVDISDDQSIHNIYVKPQTVPNLYKKERPEFKRPKPKKRERAKLTVIEGNKREGSN